MIKKIQISNYKSIDTLDFELGRINVLIGENGAGKSNILEAIALADAAAANKLDNEFLTSHGIRVTSPEYMRPAFPGFNSMANISITLELEQSENYLFQLINDNTPYSKWNAKIEIKLRNFGNIVKIANDLVESTIQAPDFNQKQGEEILAVLNKISSFEKNKDEAKTLNLGDLSTKLGNKILELTKKDKNTSFSKFIENFIIYSPENTALRTFQREGQIEPLGINGEGLLKLLSVLSSPEYSDSLNEIRKSLQILGWFEDISITEPVPFSGSRIEIKDRYLDETRRYFDQLSTNEGFLFLLFYFALFSTDLTPQFFAIDNIDASLNPKLCEKLMRELIALAVKHDKQVIFTTHNPAILDGLNLDDDEQRLFVVSRNKNGATRLKRVNKPATKADERPTRLSELFLRGVLGGLPKGF